MSRKAHDAYREAERAAQAALAKAKKDPDDEQAKKDAANKNFEASKAFVRSLKEYDQNAKRRKSRD